MPNKMNNRTLVPVECQACHKIIQIGEILIKHHISYFPEKIIPVHASCHSYIHVHKTKYQHLAPDARQLLRWYKKHNSNYRYTIDIQPEQLNRFMDCIENGFMTKERKEKIKELEFQKYFLECERIREIKERLNITETWNSALL